MQKIIVAIDGYSGTGKSSTAKAVAKELGYTYIDSGAMYRAATLYFLDQKVEIKDLEAVRSALGDINIHFDHDKVLLNGQDVSDEIRMMKVNQMVSKVAALAEVRREMVSQQQKMGEMRGVVMDGRDIATVVFPDAELKIFMTASADVRAKRRQLELHEKGIFEDLNEIRENLIDRDTVDSTREASPLKSTDESIEIDTSDLTFEEQVNKVVELAKQVANEN